MAQARVSRTKAPAVAEEVAGRPQMRRTVRTAVSATVAAESAKATAKQEVEQRLQLIARNNAAIDDAAASNDVLYAEVEKIMKDAKLEGVTDGHLIAELKDTYSRQTRDVDVAALMKALPLKDFLSCVSVVVTEAKKFLSEKELDKISKVEAAKKIGTKLSIKEVKTETKRKAK